MLLETLRRWFGSFHDGEVYGRALWPITWPPQSRRGGTGPNSSSKRWIAPVQTGWSWVMSGRASRSRESHTIPSPPAIASTLLPWLSALSWAYPQKAWLLRTLGAIAAGTPIAVLAHWSTDVAAGLMIGVALERGARHVLTPESRRAVGRG